MIIINQAGATLKGTITRICNELISGTDLVLKTVYQQSPKAHEALREMLHDVLDGVGKFKNSWGMKE